MPGKRILITGAAGFIGSHTVDRLLDDGHDVLGVDDFSSGKPGNLAEAGKSPRFALETADVAGTGVLDGLVKRYEPEVIVHLAALVSVPGGESDPRANFRLNVLATHEVCEAARRHAVRRILFASSAAVYGRCDSLPLRESSPTVPASQYGCAKRISEQLLASYGVSYGIESTRLRYFNVYGPRQDPASPYSGVVSIFCDRYRAGNTVTIFGDGRQSRDFVFVDDVARANAVAAASGKGINGEFNCCTGVASSLLDLVAVFEEAFPGVAAPAHAPDRCGDIRHSLGDPSAMRAALGFAPGTSLRDGLRVLMQSLSS